MRPAIPVALALGLLSGCSTIGPDPACNRGDTAMVKRAYAEAVRRYDRCVASVKADPAVHADWLHRRGRAHMKLRHHDAALADFAAARRLKPDHVGAHNSTAWVHYLRGEQATADAMARKARALAPQNVRVVDTHAHILAALGRKREALEAFFLTCETLHTKDGVAKLQRQLARIGYDPGPATGTCTRKTRGALAACVWHKCTIWK